MKTAEDLIQNKPIIIVGMGRSGTSFTSSLLHSAGINMGEKLLEANHWNEKGFFEDIRFFNFHIEWLIKFNQDPDFGVLTKEQALDPNLYADAVKLIESINPINQWGFKDPRSTVFLPLWKKIFPNALFILVYRSPLEVADSLIRKATPLFLEEPMNIIKIWNQYNKIAIEELKECNFLCFDINQIKSDPINFLERVEAKGYSLQKSKSKDLFDNKLFQEHLSQHTNFSKALIESNNEVNQTYKNLQQLSNYQPSEINLCDDDSIIKNWLSGRNSQNFPQNKESTNMKIRAEVNKQ